jgi:Family of unknown function (DUF6081)
MKGNIRGKLAFWGAVVAFAAGGGVAGADTSTVTYDTFNKPGYSLADYYAKWSTPYGLIEMESNDTRSFAGKRFNVSAVPFTKGADFSVFDHLKYIGVSNTVFPVPSTGSVTFSADILASTPGTVQGLTQLGLFGAPFTWTDPFDSPAAPDYSAQVLQGQQAGVVLNMVDFCTGQLFDWFVAGNTAFPLIERLPTNVTGNTSNPNCPGATHVGRELMYTQIIKELPVDPGASHNVQIRYTRKRDSSLVDYLLDGRRVARVENVGVPLDAQGVDYTGTYPSLGHGEPLHDQISSFAIGHGLFSLLDAFPYQHPEAPELSVSIPVGPGPAGSARLFGQGASGSFDNFVVTTQTG